MIGNFCYFDMWVICSICLTPVPLISFKVGTYFIFTWLAFSFFSHNSKLFLNFFNFCIEWIGGLCPFHPFLIKSSLFIKYNRALSPLFKSCMIPKSCYCTAEAIWKTEHLPNLAKDNACWALIIPPVAIN